MPTLEPFLVQRVGFDWGKLEIGFHMPIVLYSPTVRSVTSDERASIRSRRDRFALAPEPRLTLGLVFDIDELWR